MVDYTKFNAAKLFDVDSALDTAENTSRTLLTLITDAKTKSVCENIHTASFEFARAQAQAVKAYGDAVKKALALPV